MGAGTADRRSNSESVFSQSPLFDAGDGTSPDSVRVMELKLALVKEQWERETEKDERARIAWETEFETEKEQAGVQSQPVS